MKIIKETMNKEFINYESALALKELGFDEPCFDNYNIYGKLWGLRLNKQVKIKGACLAPTFSQAFRFFREKYGLQKSICSATRSLNYYYSLHIDDEDEMREPLVQFSIYKNFATYEEAELDCLKTLIKIAKEK